MKAKVSLLLSISFLLFSGPVLAQSVTGQVTIKQLRTGWDSEEIAVETNEPVVNPANCAFPDGYSSRASKPGHKEHYAAVLSAISTKRPIRIAVSNTDCSSDRPRIMGIFLLQ